MNKKELIEALREYDDLDQIFLSGDPEGNEIRTIHAVTLYELPKKNNDGTFDAVVIWASDDIRN